MRFGSVLIAGLRQSQAAKYPGGVERLNLLVAEEFSRRGLKVGDLEFFLKGRFRAPPETMVYWQTQGFLNEEFTLSVESLLARGFVVLEHNIFGLPSKWRPIHPRFISLSPSSDTGLRFAVRQQLRRPNKPTRYGVLNKTTARGFPHRPPRRLGSENRFLRIGRPDKRKWTRFEVEFMESLAKRNPSEEFSLTLVGFPFEKSFRSPANLKITVIPFHPHPENLYRHHRYYLHDSRIGETFGNTIAEAAAAGLTVISSVDMFRDCGHFDIVSNHPSVLGTRRGLVRHASAVWQFARTLPTHSLPQHTIDFFCDQLGRFAEGLETESETGVGHLWRHLSTLKSSVTFGRPPPPLAVLVWEAAKTLKNWRARD